MITPRGRLSRFPFQKKTSSRILIYLPKFFQDAYSPGTVTKRNYCLEKNVDPKGEYETRNEKISPIIIITIIARALKISPRGQSFTTGYTSPRTFVINCKVLLSFAEERNEI